MHGDPEPSVYEVPGFHVHGHQEDTGSVNDRGDLTEQVASTFCFQWEKGAAKRCLESTMLRGAERRSEAKARGLQSGRGAPKKYSMGIKIKEEDMMENVEAKNVHVSSSPELEHMGVPRSSYDGKNVPKDVVIIEDDSDGDDSENSDDNELNMENLANHSEDDEDPTTESDASSTKIPRSTSCQSTRQRFNCNMRPTLNTQNSADEDDCQVFEQGRFVPFRSMKRGHRQRSPMQNFAGHNIYAHKTKRSLDNVSSDCEIMEDSCGKIRELWEEAARKQAYHGMKCKGPLVEDGFSASGSNLDPSSPLREFDREGRNKQVDTNFQGHQVDVCSTDLPDLVSASGVVYNSAQDDVTSHKIPMEVGIQNSSEEISKEVSLSQSTNTADVQPSIKGNEWDRNHGGVKIREFLEHPYPTSQEEINKSLKSSSVEAKSEFAMVENSSEWVADREKLKKTTAFIHAEQEEWVRRQSELQRQAEEAQRQRMRKRAEATRKLDTERRQKQRVEEWRETQKKDEETMDLKERLRCQVNAQLEQVASKSKDMASLLRQLNIPVEGGAFPLPHQVNAAYKQALLRFHPDRASNHDLRYQVEAEETFKLISRLKDTWLPVAPTYLHRSC